MRIKIQLITIILFNFIVFGQQLKTYTGKYKSGTATYQYYIDENLQSINHGIFVYEGHYLDFFNSFRNNRKLEILHSPQAELLYEKYVNHEKDETKALTKQDEIFRYLLFINGLNEDCDYWPKEKYEKNLGTDEVDPQYLDFSNITDYKLNPDAIFDKNELEDGTFKVKGFYSNNKKDSIWTITNGKYTLTQHYNKGQFIYETYNTEYFKTINNKKILVYSLSYSLNQNFYIGDFYYYDINTRTSINGKLNNKGEVIGNWGISSYEPIKSNNNQQNTFAEFHMNLFFSDGILITSRQNFPSLNINKSYQIKNIDLANTSYFIPVSKCTYNQQNKDFILKNTESISPNFDPIEILFNLCPISVFIKCEFKE